MRSDLTKGRLPHYDSRAFDSALSPVADANHPDLGGDPLPQLLDMRDKANQLSLLLKSRQRLHSTVERLFVERSKPFIEKERIDLHIPARHLREAEGKSEAHQKALSTREVLSGTPLTSMVEVDDIDLE